MKKTLNKQCLTATESLLLDTAKKPNNFKLFIVASLAALTIIAALIVFFILIPIERSSLEIGHTVGSSCGNVVGTAIGSVEGVSDGIAEGVALGISDGLSATDTIVEISNSIENNIHGLGKLEVLIANTELTNFNNINDKYAALYLLRGRVTFTIDLNSATVTHKDGFINIVLPQPTAEIHIDHSETEQIAEWSANYFNGTDSKGVTDYINSTFEIISITPEKLENYSELIKLAKESAKRQVQSIASAVCLDTDIEITVTMRDE